MAEKIATRAAYGEALVALAEEYPELVVLDADLSGSTMTKGFAKAHPDRFYNMGIAEANMTGVAAGLAACGKALHQHLCHVRRRAGVGAGAQLHRLSPAECQGGGLPRRPVRGGGRRHPSVHRGLRHHAGHPQHDGGLPCDGPEMRQAVRALLDYDGPAYLRLGRLAVESVTDAIPGYTFHLGQGVTLRDGSDATVIATGMMVQMALKAAERLAEEGLSVRVLDMHTIKPLDGELVLKAALETGAIVTTEEANVVGGLGSAVAEFLAEHHPVPVVRHGVNDVFGRSGKAEAVLEAYGLTPEGIAEKVRHAVKRKK